MDAFTGLQDVDVTRREGVVKRNKFQGRVECFKGIVVCGKSFIFQ